MTRREFRDLATPEDVRDAIERLDVGGGTETVSLEGARGRVLAERVTAGIDVPGFDRAAMDGYAVRAEDTFGAREDDRVQLSVIDSIHAGDAYAIESAAGGDGSDLSTTSPATGEAVQIATGAAMPKGADAVVPVERTIEGEGVVEITTAVTPGESVMPRGADIASGNRALGPGTKLGQRQVGVLAALGRETVPVYRRPSVTILSTGEELVQPGDALNPETGQIYDVNSQTLTAAVESAGGNPNRFRCPGDDRAELREALETATAEADLVLTSGSTSAGTVDYLHEIIEDAGETLVHGVALKPGRPLLVGRVFDTPYVGLPGYPVSALTVFRTFVAPAIRAAVGQPEPAAGTVEAELRTRVRYDGGRLRLVAVGLVGDGTGGLVAYARSRGSGATTSLVETDGIVRMAPGTNHLSREERVTVERFDSEDPLPSLLLVGDPDPVVSEVLDQLERPRQLTMAQRDARRWLQDDIPDVAVLPDVGSPSANDTEAGADRGDELPQPLTTFEREWGLVVPPGNPAGITALSDLAGTDQHFATLDADLGLRQAFNDWVDADGADEASGTGSIDGFDRELPGLESAARSVARGRADAGLGLGATAADLELGFVPLGTQRLAIVANPGRQTKSGLQELCAAIDDQLEEILTGTPGYRVPGG